MSIHRSWSATVRRMFDVDDKTVVTAYGQRYGADGWSESQALFSFNPLVDEKSHMEQAEELAVRGPGNLAMHGAERLTGVRRS